MYVFKKEGEDITPVTDLSKMSKGQLEQHGRTLGIELDKRLSKSKLIEQLEEVTNA